MALVTKIVCTTSIPSQTTTKLNMRYFICNKLISRSCSGKQPADTTMYDARKLCHHLSPNTTNPNFLTLKNIPTGVFRHTKGEILGLGAGKGCLYQNPEYFSFHHMSFYDLNIGLRQYRKPCPKTERKPN